MTAIITAAASAGAARFGKYCPQIHAACFHGGEEPEQESGGKSNRDCNEQNPSIEMNAAEQIELIGVQVQKLLKSKPP